MHLLALLVAAAFSSSFVAPNALGTFTVVPKTITPAQLDQTPEFTTTIPKEKDGAVSGYFAIDEETGIADGLVIEAGKVTVSGDVLAIDADFNISAKFTIAPLPASIFIFLKDAEDPYQHAEVPVADTWTIECDGGLKDTQLTKLPELTIIPKHEGGWNENMKAKFSFKRGTDPAVNVSHPIERADDDVDKYKYTVPAGESLAALGILTADFFNATDQVDVTLTVSIVLDEAGTEYPLTASLAIKLDKPEFSVPTDPVSETDLAAPTTTIMITPPASGADWEGLVVTAVFTLEKTPPTNLESTFKAAGENGSTAAAQWTFEPSLAALPLEDTTKEIYVWIHVAATTPKWETGCGTLKVTLENPPTGTVTLGKTSIAYADLTAPGDISIELKDSNTAINANGKYKISYGEGDDEKNVTGSLEALDGANAASHKIASTDLSQIGIPNEAVNAKVTIYPTGTRNALAAVNLGITVSEIDFDVTPETLTTIPTSIAKLTITPKDDTNWNADGISAKLTFDTYTKAINLTADTPLTNANEGSGRTYSAGPIDVSTLTGLKNGSVIAVHAAKGAQSSSPQYLPVTASITIDLPVPKVTNFTIPATDVKFADPFKVPQIEVTPTTEKDWEALLTAGHLKFCYTVTAPASNVAADNITGLLTKTGTGEDVKFFIPETLLTPFELEEEDLPKKLVLQISEDNEVSHLACTAAITLSKAAAPTAKFAISPADVTEGKLAKADSPKFTITIVDGVEKPAIADFAKVIFKAGEKTLTVEFVPSGTAEAPKWEIAAAESDFSTLNITTFPVVGSAEFFPDKAGVAFGPTVPFTFKAAEKPEAAMGVSPLFTLLAALVFLFVKLF